MAARHSSGAKRQQGYISKEDLFLLFAFSVIGGALLGIGLWEVAQWLWRHIQWVT